MYPSSLPVEPINFVTPLEDVVLEEVGIPGVFSCEVSKSGLKAEWFVGEKPIKASDKYEIREEKGTHTLTIKNSQPDDEGKYSIKIKGFTTSATLTIKGKTLLKSNYSQIKPWNYYSFTEIL